MPQIRWPAVGYVPWKPRFNPRVVCGICGGLIDLGVDDFLLPAIIPPMLHTHLSSGVGTTSPSEAVIPGNSCYPIPATVPIM
jgi:hypothetical protein